MPDDFAADDNSLQSMTDIMDEQGTSPAAEPAAPAAPAADDAAPATPVTPSGARPAAAAVSGVASAAAAQTPAESAQSTGEDEPAWPDLSVPDAQPDPLAKFKLDEFKALQDPRQIRAVGEQAIAAIEQVAPRLAQFAQLETAAEAVGGLQNVTKVMDLTGLLFGGAADGEDGSPAPLSQFLDRVKDAHGPTYDNLVFGIAKREMPLILDALAPNFLKHLGLDPEKMEQYQALTLTGVYSPDVDQEEERNFLGRIPPGLHDAYRKLPIHKRTELRAASTEAATWDLTQYAELQRLSTERATEKAEREKSEAAAYEAETTKINKDEEQAVFTRYVKMGVDLGLTELEAEAVALRTDRKVEALIKSDQDVARKFRAFGDAAAERNQIAMDRARKGFEVVVQKAWREALTESKPKRRGAGVAPVAKPGQPSTGARPRAANGQFTPDQPGEEEGMPSMLDILDRLGAGSHALTGA